MRALSIQVKVTVAIVLALLVVDGVGVGVAESNFRQSETQHAREQATAKTNALANVLELRLRALSQIAWDAAQSLETATDEQTAQTLQRAGFTSFVVIGPDGDIAITGGDARDDPGLREDLAMLAPLFPGRTYMEKYDHLILSVRSNNHKYAIIGAIDRDTLASSFLADILIDATGANLVMTKNDELVAASQGFNTPDPSELESLPAGDEATLGDEAYLVQRANLSGLEGYVVHLVPKSAIDARVNALAFRFFETSTAAMVLAGVATILIVTVAFRPLSRITEAARKLGRGEEDLNLHVRSRDALGLLASVMNDSARKIGEARRRQAQDAEKLKLAAEDFQLAVGGLARSVGEAESAPEVARRLCEASLKVTSARAALVMRGDAIVAVTTRASEVQLDDAIARALVTSTPEAWSWSNVPGDNARLALLPSPAGASDADARKLEILVHQAALAFHRTRVTDRLKVYVDILSHDLKNPLAVARGRVEMLATKQPDCKEKLDAIEQSLDRATRIIDEAVLFSKLEGKVELAREPLDLAQVAKDAVHALAPLADARGIELAVSAPRSVMWDANPLLARAVENLLSNAIKWSPDRSTVIVDVEPAQDACRIRVIDHGPGIPHADRARLFGRFERADKVGVKGVGLGLAISKRVVDVHGGRIHIEDTPGGGCTFVIELPAGRGPARSLPPHALPPEGLP